MTFIKHIIAGLLLLPALLSFSQGEYFQQKVNHRIRVALDPAEKKLEVFQEINYTNNSKDTLRFIYFHLWPNAFRNDRTSFSDQLLRNNRTDFYFSKEAEKGYINRLDFKVNGEPTTMEDHPIHQDIIKLVLPRPLIPGGTLEITTPFQVKLPALFSRTGYHKDFFSITHWYPQPAVYNREGWQEMPYLDQGGNYSEFGDYDISITLPDSFRLVAQGTLVSGQKQGGKTGTGTSTFRYLQKNITTFAWFASPGLTLKSDTLLLPSGKLVALFNYVQPASEKTWANSLAYTKESLRQRSASHGEYPYDSFIVLDGFQGPGITTMSYPGLALINQAKQEAELDLAIHHAAGKMWFGSAVATNERNHAWLNEGLISFYDNRYKQFRYGTGRQKKGWKEKFFPEGPALPILGALESIGRSQDIQTSSDSLKQGNYILLNRYKAARVLENTAKQTGTEIFDSTIRQYIRQHHHQHVEPADLFNSFAQGPAGSEGLKENMYRPVTDRQTRAFTRIMSIGPMAGYNHYDGLMLGGFLHNYQLPLPRFRYMITPLFGTRSKSVNGLANISWNWYPTTHSASRAGAFRHISIGVDAARFTGNEFRVEPAKLSFQYQKLAPYLRLELSEKNQLSVRERYIQYKSFLISEEWLDSKWEINGNDTILTDGTRSASRTLQQLKIVLADHRVLYPYELETKLESGRDFTRLAITGQYFVNFPNREGGLRIRLFAGKFFTHGENTIQKQFSNDRYYLNLTGANGYEDYTYSNYFAGRNQFEGWKSQQIMMRDGGFKVRTDLSSEKAGKTGNWLSAINFTADIPSAINPLSKLPVKIPLKLYADLGTYAEAWKSETESTKLLFSAGLQLPLFKNLVNIYIPVVNSKVFREYNQSILGDKKFWKTISFSIDIQQISAGKLLAKAGL